MMLQGGPVSHIVGWFHSILSLALLSHIVW